MAAFLAQDLLDRVVAALLLGQGITGGDCIRWDPSVGAPTVCDGDPGGIFAVGTDENGNYNPMAYPGQATGQYNLNEIHTGISTIAPEQLPPPWNDFDGDGTVGAPREPNSELPAPGQVRLGTVAAAVSGEAPVLPYGIPILGATHDAYEDYLIHAGTVDSHYAIGKTFIETSNFFSYRLPVLSSYWPRSGLRHTPKGVDPLSTKETARYFFPETPYDNTQSDLVYELADSPGDWRLHTAGAYTWGRSLFEDETDFPYTDGEEEPSDQDLPFSQDGWFWQIARYRHSFYVEDGDTVGAKGTFWFFHFKTEEDFEKFARDGIMPWDATDGYELYGAHPNGEAIEDYANLVNEDPGTGVNPHEAPEYGYRGLGYFLNKSSVYLADSDDQDDIAFANHVWQWTDGGVTMMRSSGVAHFNPMDIAAGVPLFTISTLNAQVNGGGAADPWTAVYRVDDNPLTGAALPPARVSSPNPAFLYVGHFSYDEDAGAPTMTVPPAFAVPRNVRKQRIEFPYDYLGAFNEANGPDFADNLTMQLGLGETIRPDGDTNYPAFSMNARPRAFVRRPLAHEDWEDAVQPSYVAGTGAGQACVAVDTREVLFHSTVFTVGAGAGNGPYGNFITGAPNSPAYASLGTALKDTEERFLDEVYRIHQGFGGMAAGVGGDQLRGPGMQGWVAGFISTPIRVGHTIDATWIPASWVQTGTHDDNNCLNNNPFELQVGGLPDRNPPLSDWVKYAMPSSGILQYPKVDYTAGYAPDLASEGVTQPDYSACAGTRSFTRALDVAFENSGTAEAVEGTVFVTLRIDGIRLEDFAYTAPGPGHTANGIAVLVKVPGLTTWMDLGRPDGGGPGKQDPVLDGAGCKVSGQYTYDYIDRETGVAYCQVVANVGPVAALQKNSDDTVPVLVRVVMRDAPALSSNYDFNHEYNSDTSTWTGTTGPGISSRFVRGIVGLRLIRESQKAEKPAA